MKKAMSNVDVTALVSELQRRLVGGFVGKSYQITKDSVWITFQSPAEGRLDLLMEAGRRIHLTRKERVAGKTPPQFPTMLRSHLSGGRLVAVEQYDFDRVVQITVERSGTRRLLVVELFPKGNVLLLDQDMRIILPLRPMAFRGRKLVAGEEYVYHQGQRDPRDIPIEFLANLLKTSDADLVRTLVRGLNMGGIYGEEVCLKAKIDKNVNACDLTPEQVEQVYQALGVVFGAKEYSPRIFYRDGFPVDVVPAPLLVYEGLESKEYSNFSDALDEFFVAEKPAEKTSPLQRRLDFQRRSIQEFQALEREMAALGELVYNRYQEIEAILKVIASAKEKGYSYTDIWKRLSRSDLPMARAIKSLDYKGELRFEIDGVDLELNAEMSVPQNAERYYERSKEAARKAAGAMTALAATEQLQGQKSAPKKGTSKFKRRKPKWYERFRWFVSTDGFLVIGGRDSDGNEEIYNKYLEKRDMAFHTDYPGAPLTVIKTEGHDVPETTLNEAAQFAVSYSTLWKEGLAAGDCYMISGDQVTKTPEHGEFLRKGAFVIRGERRYFKDVPLGVAVAIVGDQLIGGPNSAISDRADEAKEEGIDTSNVVEVEPGEFNSDDLAKRIYRQFSERYDDRRYLKMMASTETIVSFLPSGGSKVREDV